MMKRVLFAFAAIAAVSTAPLAGQAAAPRFSAEPYLGYGFFGGLPDTNSRLEAAVAYGGRVAFQLSPQWAAFGNYQRSTPEQLTTVGGPDISRGNVDVDHWAAGVEFSYVPRGGAEGMLPIILEAGLGQARYDRLGLNAAESDLAAKLGISSALQLSPNFGVRYGADSYISNFRDQGIVNQVFVRVGAELSF
jgi:hypothetical protein